MQYREQRKPWDNVYLELKGKPEIVSKYFHAGVYSITIAGRLVYIGKSRDMLYRLAQHIFYTNNPYCSKSHKYKILHLAQFMGYDIQFNTLYIASTSGNVDDEIGNKEGELIRQYLPPLNYQIPKEEDYHSFTVNKRAKIIKLMDILGECGKENQLNY